MTDVRDLLFELGTEELPPKHLSRLASSLADQIKIGFDKADLNFSEIKWYATPRRLAVYVHDLQVQQESKEETRRGPALAAAYDDEGKATKAAEGFARSCKTEVEQLDVLETDKGKWLSYTVSMDGQFSKDLLGDIINHACQKLPIAKRMRWGTNDTEFVRPVHWSVLLFGTEIINTEILGTKSGNRSYGHRFHAPQAIILKDTKEYKQILKDKGYVLVDFQERKEHIRNAVETLAKEQEATALIEPELLDEVSSINEWPVALLGHFEKDFLELPDEVLIASMQDHQKYFPLTNKKGELLPGFITIANIESKNLESVRAGNERVLNPRLSDARFFWQQDLKKKLEEYSEQLDKVLYQKQLGSMGDKTQRIIQLAKTIAEELNANIERAGRAAELCKCDLLTDMVAEFPELQGTMGYYYAIKNGEHEEVAKAIKEQYQPRFSGDAVPATRTGQILSLAEKLDTIIGIFSIGQIPTGDKDPFALRRNALGVLRIMIECELDLNLKHLLKKACDSFSHNFDKTKSCDAAFSFMMERLRAYYLENGVDSLTFESVLSRRPDKPLDYHQRINAVVAFQQLAEARDLASANKRISNILKKADADIADQVEIDLLHDEAEKQLANSISKIETIVKPLFAENNYCDALQSLASLRDPIDKFFDEVMVMTDDESIKMNRLALLNSVNNLFLETADISKLQGIK